MANTLQTTTVYNSPRKIVVNTTGTFDGSGQETDLQIIDKSAAANVGPNGLEPSKLVVEEINATIEAYGGGYVLLEFDHTADDEIAVLSQTDYIDFRPMGGMVDPATAGGTGDIILTTGSFAATDSYNITITCRKKD